MYTFVHKMYTGNMFAVLDGAAVAVLDILRLMVMLLSSPLFKTSAYFCAVAAVIVKYSKYIALVGVTFAAGVLNDIVGVIVAVLNIFRLVMLLALLLLLF